MGLAEFSKMFARDVKSSIVNLGGHEKIDVIPTGSIVLDWLTGVGGIPRGRVTEIFGSEGNGKTTIAIHVAQQAQALGLDTMFLDFEHALDKTYAEKLGLRIDQDTCQWHQPESISQSAKFMHSLWGYLDSGKGNLGLIVVDSVAMMYPQEILDAVFDDQNKYIALQAIQLQRLISQWIRQACKRNIAVLLINQVREKPNALPWQKKTYSTGGRALKFFASVRIELASPTEKKMEVARTGEIDVEDEGKKNRKTVYTNVIANCVKCKVSEPFRKDALWIRMGEGIDNVRTYIEKGVEYGFIERAGAYYKMANEQFEGGIEGLRTMLKDPTHKATFDWLREKVRAIMWPPKPPASDAPPAPPTDPAGPEKPKTPPTPSAGNQEKPKEKPKAEKIRVK